MAGDLDRLKGGLGAEKAEAAAVYAAKRIALGFAAEADYKKALRSEAELQALQEGLAAYEQAVRRVEHDLTRLVGVTKDQEKQDLDRLEAKKTELEQEQQALDELRQMIGTRLEINLPPD